MEAKTTEKTEFSFGCVGAAGKDAFARPFCLTGSFWQRLKDEPLSVNRIVWLHQGR